MLPALLRSQQRDPIRKAIPASGESLPVIGLGTACLFDVDPESEAARPLEAVLSLISSVPRTLVGVSPSFGKAERVLGRLMKGLGVRKALFVATEVSAVGEEAGVASLKRSVDRLRADPIDLVQVSNLLDWGTQLRTLREWREKGRIRYVGVTCDATAAYGELEQLMKKESLDFIQLGYSLAERGAEERLLPLAADRRIAVIAARPFARGELFHRVGSRPLPPWAREFDCQTWAQLFLKFVVSHPSVTVAIPATSKLPHMEDNLGAGVGRLPDEAGRRRIAEHLLAL